MFWDFKWQVPNSAPSPGTLCIMVPPSSLELFPQDPRTAEKLDISSAVYLALSLKHAVTLGTLFYSLFISWCLAWDLALVGV